MPTTKKTLMKQLNPILLCCFFYCSFLAFPAIHAQTISGTLKDGYGLPLEGILIEKSQKRALARTDANGAFSIAAQAGDTLFIYYEKRPEEVVIGDQTRLDLILGSTWIYREALSEPVETGYGTQPKNTITSAITVLEETDFNYGNRYDPLQLIQGRVPGLLLSKPGDDPMGSFDLHQRGLHTLQGDGQMLLVVDGFVGASPTSVDPHDIASITLLRDAASAAIYGTRAANGVLLITTKSTPDTDGKLRVGINTYTGFQQVARFQDVLNADRYSALQNRPDIESSNLIVDHGSDTDWQSAIAKKGFVHHSNVWAGWSKAGTSVRASANLRNVGDVIPSAGFSQFNGALNIGQSLLKDRLRLQLHTAATTRDFSQAPSEIFFQSAQYNPTAPIRSDDPFAEMFGGYFQDPRFQYFNPVAIVEQTEHGGNLQTYTANFSGSWNLWRNLRIDGRLAWQNDKKAEAFYAPRESFYQAFANGMAEYKGSSELNRLSEVTVSYDFKIGNGTLSIGGGHSYQFITRKLTLFSLNNYDTENFSYQNLSVTDVAENNVGVNSNTGLDIRLAAFRGHLQYNLNNWLFLAANARYEGCSRFGDNREWGLFYGFSGGLDFAKALKLKNIDQLKFRMSYGLSGNLPPDDILAGTVYGESGTVFFNGEFIPSIQPFTDSNPNLQWESRSEMSYGLDFSLVNGRISGSFDTYRGRSTDVLFGRTVFSSFFGRIENDSELSHQGAEVYLDFKLVEEEDFTLQLDVNYSTSRTQYEKLMNSTDFGSDLSVVGSIGNAGSNQYILLRTGVPVGEIVGRNLLNVTNGFPVFSEPMVIGSTQPANFWGIGGTVRWKQFDFGIRMRGAQGHSILNETQFILGLKGNADLHNVLSSALEPPASTISQGFQPVSTLFVSDASFLRIDNVRLGYRFDLQNNRYLSGLQIYLAAQNLATISEYKGPDPEVRLRGNGIFTEGADLGIAGADLRRTHWPVKTFLLGVNVDF